MPDFNIFAAALLSSLPAAFAVQLLLCFKAKGLFLRLMPIALSLSASVCLYALQFAMSGWSAAYASVLSFIMGLMAFSCALAFGVWALVRSVKKRRQHS